MLTHKKKQKVFVLHIIVVRNTENTNAWQKVSNLKDLEKLLEDGWVIKNQTNLCPLESKSFLPMASCILILEK